MTERTKYPRTFHMPESEKIGSDDKRGISLPKNMKVAVSIKMDGENTSMTNSSVWARSLDTDRHESRDWVRRFHSTIAWAIPDGITICGENLYARHTIPYDSLPSYLLAFFVKNGDRFLSVQDTVKVIDDIETASGVKVHLVNNFYVGEYSPEAIISLFKRSFNGQEGFVVRNVESFLVADFSKNVAKFVSSSFDITGDHWKKGVITPNLIAG